MIASSYQETLITHITWKYHFIELLYAVPYVSKYLFQIDLPLKINVINCNMVNKFQVIFMGRKIVGLTPENFF